MNRGSSVIDIKEGIITGRRDTREITNLKEFINYVFKDCSYCIKDVLIVEIKDSKLYDDFKDKSDVNINLCNLIITKFGSIAEKIFISGHKGSKLKGSLVLRIIELFLNKGLLSKRGSVYYLLGSNKRLSWLNIKQLKSRDILLDSKVKAEIISIFGDKYTILYYIKSLFWFFRKAVVDSIVSDMINNYTKSKGNVNIIAMSVGSTSLSSDYDISLDGTYKSSAYIIDKFSIFIGKIFNDDSDSLFDTNIYGVSFIKKNIEKPVITPESDSKDANNLILHTFNSKHRCKDGLDEFLYIENNIIDTSQIIWSYVKTLLKLNMILKIDDKVYDKLYSSLEDALSKNNYFKSAQIFVNKYESNVENYKNIVNRIDEYLFDNRTIDDESYLISNFISFVNYNGSETYLTNGAFLDVVVNQQMCKDGNPVIIYNPILYLTSFIENVSDLMIHYHKKKYKDRCMLAFKKYGELLKGYDNIKNNILDNIYNKLTKIGDFQTKCQDDILDCQSFKMMYECINCIIEISKLNDNGDQDKTQLFDSIIFPIDNKMDIQEK